jgi:hypothetical protein
MGRRLRNSSERAVAGSGIDGVVISGLANDFIQYFVTPEEYDRQHYEGGSTLFGRATSVFIQERLVSLLRRMVDGRPAPPPDQDERRNGVTDDEPAFERGAASGAVLRQPAAVMRLQRARVQWRGGPRGTDRPLDRPFVVVERRGKRWRAVDDDLGLRILWTVDGEGRYTARWEAPLTARPGRYRFSIQANRYRLRSDSFRLARSRELEAWRIERSPGRMVVELRYPEAVENEDLTWRPRVARIRRADVGGRVRKVRIDGRRLIITGKPGTRVTIERGALRDAHGNRNGNRLALDL